MSQYNNIIITPNIGVSSSPKIEFTVTANTLNSTEKFVINEIIVEF